MGAGKFDDQELTDELLHLADTHPQDGLIIGSSRYIRLQELWVKLKTIAKEELTSAGYKEFYICY